MADARRRRHRLGGAGHDAGRRSRRRCASCWSSATTRATAYVPARVLNLVCIVDRQWSGEIANRLRARRALPRVAHDRLRGQRGAHDDRCRRLGRRGRGAERRRARADPRDGDPRPRTRPSRAPRDDRRSARDHRPDDARLGAARPLGGRRRAARALAVRAAGLRRGPRRRGRAAPRAATARRPLRRRPRLAALDAMARAHRDALRPAGAARAPAGEIAALRIRNAPESGAAALLLCGWLRSRLGWPQGTLDARRPRARRSGRWARSRCTLELGAPGRSWPLRASRSVCATAASSRSTAAPGGLRATSTRRRGDGGHAGRCSAPRAARAGSSARGCASRCSRDPTYGEALASAEAMLT